jgi:hypothetical protein
MIRRAFVFWQLTCGLVLSACGAASLVPDAGPDATPDAGSDAGAGPSCPAGAHALSDGGCDATLSWLNGTPATTGVNHHGTLIATPPDAGSSALFVLGGVSGPAGATVNSAISAAPIGDDGFLGSWHSAGALPVPLAGFTFAQRDNALFVVSGITQSGGSLARTRGTSLGTLGGDGTWGSWVDGPSLPAARFHAAQATVGDFTYVLGGVGEVGEITGTVYRSRFTGDAATAWDTLSPLPDVRSHDVAVAVGKRIYLVAGLKVDSADPADLYTDALVADVGDDGALSDWRTASTSALPMPVTAASGFEKDGFIYLLGGVTSTNGSLQLTNAVHRARILGSGQLDAWETLAPLPKARGHVHQTPLFRNRFAYSVCGTSDLNHDSITDVFIALFN